MDCYVRVHILAGVPALHSQAPCVAGLAAGKLVYQLNRNLLLLSDRGFVARYLAELQRWIVDTKTTLGQLNFVFQHINAIQSGYECPFLSGLTKQVETLLNDAACEETAILYIYLQQNRFYFPLLAAAPLARVAAAVQFFETCAVLAGLGHAQPACLACERAKCWVFKEDFYYYRNGRNQSCAAAFLGAAFAFATYPCADDFCDLLMNNYDKFEQKAASGAVEQIVEALGWQVVLENWPGLLTAAARRSERIRLWMKRRENEA